jgi:hypothetical protein
MRHKISLTLALALSTLAHADCGPFFSPPTRIAETSRLPVCLLARDLDGSGFPEIIQASRTANIPSSVRIFRRDAQGNYTQIQSIAMDINPPSIDFLIDDTNNDGILDLLVTEYRAGSVRIHLGIGDGTFAVNSAAYSVGSSPTKLAYEDLNNDGFKDILASNVDDDTVSILMGAAGGGFFPRFTTPAGGDGPGWLGLADINGDGRLDLLTTTVNPPALTRSLGNGNGTFQIPAAFSSQSSRALQAPVITDITSDGVPDVVMTKLNSEFIIYRGVSNGTFIFNSVPADSALGVVRSLAVADLNADGREDLLALQGDTNKPLSLVLYLKGLDLTFAGSASFGQFGMDSVGRYPVVIADINNDSLPDAVFQNVPGELGALQSITGGAIQIQSGPANQAVAPGGTAQFTASSPSPGALFRWYRNGNPIRATARITGVNTPTLTIFNAQQTDAGIYECRISNPCDTKSVSGYLHVAAIAPACPADFNGDEFLDFFDYADFVQAFEEGC